VSWQRVKGHEAQIQAFDQAQGRGRLAHAYLFTGPAGIGKRLFAGELARALLCERPPDHLDACDHCTSCKLIEAGTHPDFFTVARPEDRHEVPIELMLELGQNFGLKSARGRGKVAILDDADDLNEESANCFLKTLEEPPPRSVLILIGTSTSRQLPTIVSRCQVVRFAPLPEPLVVELLRQQGIEDAALLARLVRLSGGSPGQAMLLADPELWAFRRTLLEGLTREQPDTVTLAKEWTQFVEEAGKESAAQRRRATLVLRLLIDFLNDALTLRLGGTPRLAEAEDLQLLERLAKRVDPERLLAMLERCLEADTQIERYVQLVLVLEGLMDALGQTLRGV
jgi:DNA polymerase-3 subunit delta'